MNTTKERVRAVINSKDRLNPLTETSSNFTFSFNRDNSRITEIIIESIQIPFSFYTINAYNNVLTLDSGSKVITITVGNYTAQSLSIELKNKINTAFGDTDTTVTFSSNTYKISIIRNTTFIVDSVTDVPASTASKLLGFKQSTASSVNATAQNALNISGPNYLLVVSEYLTKPVHQKTLYLNNNYRNVLMTVPVNTSPGNIITMDPQSPIRFSYKYAIMDADIIDIKIKDEDENIIDLNGLDIAIQIVFVTE